MKKFTLTFSILFAFGAGAFAGGYSKDKEVMQQAPPACDWYRAHEWDFDFWGTFAISGNTGDNPIGFFLEPSDAHVPEGTGNPPGSADPNEHVPFFPGHNDRFMARDNAWGGGLDVKYFFSKHWGAGVEGLIVDCERNIGGGSFATLTFRWPIGCSRFAPYAFAGPGVIAGGVHQEWFHNEIHNVKQGPNGPFVVEREFNAVDGIPNRHAEAAGQAGAGLEFRVTRHVGLMGDFAWNMVSGPSNNFGLARFGLTLSY